jgi:hypothetical protein
MFVLDFSRAILVPKVGGVLEGCDLYALGRDLSRSGGRAGFRRSGAQRHRRTQVYLLGYTCELTPDDPGRVSDPDPYPDPHGSALI